MGEKDVRYHGGAPTKEEKIKAFAAANPGLNHSQIARALGVSRPTVIKWLKS
jgi:transposase-like protein